MVDQNLEGGASEGAEDLELELELSEDEKKELGGDPLDVIQDPVTRAEAKKHRAIARRSEKEKKPAAQKVEKPSTSSEFVTRAEFQKANEKKAVLQITADAEIKAVWSEIIPFYTPRRGKETTEDIVEDLKDAITIYNARNPKDAIDDSANVLKTTTVIKSGGGGTVEKTTQKPKEPPNFKLPTKPVDWYPKKEN